MIGMMAVLAWNLLLAGKMTIALFERKPMVVPDASKPMMKQPSMLEATSVKYAPSVLCLRPGQWGDTVTCSRNHVQEQE